MLTLPPVIALAIAACLLAYQYLIYPAFISPLSKLPSAHTLCTISEKWLERKRKQQKESKTLYTAHQEHGPIVRIGSKEISVNSLAGLRSIYTAGLEKGVFYSGKFENYDTLNLVSTLDHRTHSVEKRMISSVYAKSYVQHSPDVATLSNQIIFERYLPLLKQYANGNEAVNVMDLFQWVGIDFQSAYSFGTARSTNFLADKAGREAYFEEWSKFREEFIGEKKVVEAWGMKLLKDTLKERVNERKSEGSNSVVASLLHAQLSKKAEAGENNLSNEALMRRCASELLDHMVAAHETFAIVLTYIMYRLSLDPAMQTCLRFELMTLTPSISNNATRRLLPEPQHIDSLPLLNAVLLETLRLHSPTPGRLPRVAPAGGMKLHEYYIPAGTTVSCNGYSLHRKEEIFPRPFEWLPQRWMAEKDRSSLGPDFPPPETIRRYMWAFGSGGRMCIGSNFATQGAYHCPSLPDLKLILYSPEVAHRLHLHQLHDEHRRRLGDREIGHSDCRA